MMRADISDLLTILEDCPFGLALVRRSDGIVMHATRRLSRLLEDEYPVGRPFSDCFLEGADIAARLAAGDGFADLDVRLRRLRGEPVWCSLSATGLDLSGEAMDLCWLVDIETRKQGERTLREGRHLLQALFDATSDAVALISPEGRIFSVNAVMASTLDRVGERLEGVDLWSLLPPAAAAQMRAQTALAVDTGGHVQGCEHRGDRYLDNRIYPIEDDAGDMGMVALFSRDITPIRQRDLQLRKLSLALDQAPVSVMITDAQGRIEYANKAFTTISGYGPEEVIGHNPRILKSGQMPAALYADLWASITAGRSWQGEFCNRRKDGSLYWEQASICPVRDEDDVITSFLAVKENITARKDYENRLVHQATHDMLTGLPNRALLQDRLAHAMELARRDGGKLALLFVDLDRFKLVNDSLGHDVGDHILVTVAERLRRSLRRSDTIARLGGDEFVVLLGSFQTAGEVGDVADKIIRRIAQPIGVGEREMHIGASIGVAFFPDDGEEPAALMKNADAAMYRAKSAGRNSFRFADAALNGKAAERLDLEAALRRGLEVSEFELHYQPRVALGSGRLLGFEALIRWNCPGRGLVPPAVFLPLAEETDLAQPIGHWALAEACRQLARWRDEGWASLPLSVNLSARQLLDPDLPDWIVTQLERHGLPAGQLWLDVTEDAMMTAPERAVRQLAHLRDLGLAVALDDFGVGYASLASLKTLPIDAIKIDRTIVRGVETNPADGAILAAVVAMGRALGVTVIAEGVETAGQEDCLLKAGCAEAQGFFYGRPEPAAAIGAWLSSQSCRQPA